MVVANGLIVPVLVGFAAGIGFIVLFGFWLSQQSIEQYTFGLIDKSRVPLDRGNTKLIIDVMLQNSTVSHLLKGRVVTISAIGDMGNRCDFGYCAKVYLLEEGKPADQMQVLVDYTNHRVAQIQYTDGW